MRAGKLRSVDRAALEGRVDVSAGDLLRHDAQTRQNLAGESRDPKFQAAEVRDRLDFLAKPAAHLGPGIARRNGVNVVGLHEFTDELQAAALVQPGILLACVETKRQDRVEDEGWILADVEIGQGVAAFDRSVLHRVHHLQGRHDLAGSKWLDLELPVGRLGDTLGDLRTAAVKRIEALGIAGGQSPVDPGVRLGDRRSGDGRCRTGGKTGAAKEFAAVHDVSSC